MTPPTLDSATPSAPDATLPAEARRSPAARLAANLAALGDRNSELRQQLSNARTPGSLAFEPSDDAVPAASLGGRPLCSRRRPLAEAQRLADAVNIIDNAVVVVYGFGLGYHVQMLAQRMGKTGLIVVVEPDLALLRAVLERIDHSAWMNDALLLFITDPADRAALASKLDGAESTIALGVEFVDHPPSRERLGDIATQFSHMFSRHVETARATLMTTLLRSVDTVHNLLLNIDHYAMGAGIADLQGACAGFPAVTVAAGPSLHRNIAQLAEPGVRERCVIIAVQTTLKPLLDAGVRPHFVTALDYHEISRRFYEQIDPELLADVTLIADPKAHPVILDVYPGPIRCCSSKMLDRVLGPLARDMGELPAGATVAHLAVYLADWLGCTPICLMGQDLGFTDGLYYAPGTAIHDVWAPELGPFNTTAMMEWQRIVRHRAHLQKLDDHQGKSIYTDTQMLTYLRQFERDFAAMTQRGVSIIDASEAGAAKQHTQVMPLADALTQYADRPLPRLPLPQRDASSKRTTTVRHRVGEVTRDVRLIERTSRKTQRIIDKMFAAQDDPQGMSRLFDRIDAQRTLVDQHRQAFDMVNTVNQLGVFKRLRADRKMQLSTDLSAQQRQRAELERDRENVVWIADAAGELARQLDDATRVLTGEVVTAGTHDAKSVMRAEAKRLGSQHDASQTPEARCNIAAMIAIDAKRHRHALETDSPNEICPLHRTLERLAQAKRVDAIVLIAPTDMEIENQLDLAAISAPVIVERCDGSPFGPEHQAIAAARLFAPGAWRGGIAGLSAYDDLLCPQIMASIMRRREITAALLLGPDWTQLDASADTGVDAVIARHRSFPQRHELVFTQAVAGLVGCVVSEPLMSQWARRDRLCAIGPTLVYQPTSPQHDPIAKDLNVQIPPQHCRPLTRLTMDSPGQRRRMHMLEQRMRELDNPGPARCVELMCEIDRDQIDPLPQHIILELTTKRASTGIVASHPYGALERADMSMVVVRRLLERIAALAAECDPVALTLDGIGDSLLHDDVFEVISLAKCSGVQAVHVRTELLCDAGAITQLVESGVDVVSVDLHADRARTYEQMMGSDRFSHVLENIELLARSRRSLSGNGPTDRSKPDLAAFALPWIVPRLQRRRETHEDIDTFFDRWQHTLGSVVIEDPPTFLVDGEQVTTAGDNPLTPAATPRQVIEDQLRRRMLILSDGRVPLDERDLHGSTSIGNASTTPIDELWESLQQQRRTQLNQLGLYRP